MASQRPRDVAPRALPPPPFRRDPVRDALCRLGLTEEQFKAKQTEMMQVLLRNEPFVPKDAPPPNRVHSGPSLNFYEKMTAGSSRHGSRGRSSSVSSSSSSRGPSPTPRTPARKDNGDGGQPRPRDQMELVIEQRNRVKEVKRRESTSRHHEETRVPSTPTHDTARHTPTNYPPETPHHYRYYSERVIGEASGSRRPEHGVPVTPSTSRGRGQFKVPLPPFLLPRTPSNRDQDSSCPPTPRSSPPPIVNLVSSPGPMRPAPLEEDDCLPYVLPPGPYTTVKPELSYAAIIGQAILASPRHALALQDIYEFITTVYPYYKRGEPTWMNSVRHALSTMAVFRKVQRERSEGKSLWAVWERDLPCFEGGGFKKSLCADMATNATSSRASRKRGAEDGGTARPKRRKAAEEPTEGNQHPLPALTPVPVQPPYFPHITPYHQPYYQTACMQQQVPADVLFPPLPPSSNYHRAIVRAASTPKVEDAMQRPLKAMNAFVGVDTASEALPPSSPIQRPPSSSSIPELMPSLSNSSSPAPSSHPSTGEGSSRGPSPVVASASPNMDGPVEDPEASWLQSGVTASRGSTAAPRPNNKGKGKTRAVGSTVKKRLQTMPSLPPPPSPTLERRAAAGTRYGVRSPKRPAKASTSKQSPGKNAPVKTGVSPDAARPVTPPPMTASIEEIMRAMVQHAASGERTRSVSPLSEVEVATMVMSSACSDVEDAGERPSTPDLPPSSSLPSTPPRRLEDLEAELFNFSPFKSPMMRPTSRHGPSPTMTDNLIAPFCIPFASYLSTEGASEFLTGEPEPPTQCSPTAIPRTPKKTPPKRHTSGHRSDSPFGTPSRGMRGAFDDDLASFFQSPGGSSLFDSFLPGLSKSPVLYGLQSPGFGGQY